MLPSDEMEQGVCSDETACWEHSPPSVWFLRLAYVHLQKNILYQHKRTENSKSYIKSTYF